MSPFDHFRMLTKARWATRLTMRRHAIRTWWTS